MIHLSDVNNRLAIGGRNAIHAYNVRTAVIAMVAVTACGGVDNGERSRDQGPEPASASPTASTSIGKPSPVASLALEEGKTIEFFSYPDGTLIIERGEISTAPVLSRARGAKNLVDVWKTFSSTVRVPAILAELDQQVASVPSVRRERPIRPTISQGGIPSRPAPTNFSEAPLSEAPLESEILCGNGCCDHAWLANFWECRVNGSWFNYNYGWSVINGDDVDTFEGFVCAATGTSRWSIWAEREFPIPGITYGYINDVWDIEQQHYIAYVWRRSWEYEYSTRVNAESVQRLHTYCGVFWDT